MIIKNCTEEDFLQIWKPYLDLDRDYGEIKRTLTADDLVMGEAVACGQGIRILKQDLWGRPLFLFIISQNNNIPRIKGCIENLSQMFDCRQANTRAGPITVCPDRRSWQV